MVKQSETPPAPAPRRKRRLLPALLVMLLAALLFAAAAAGAVLWLLAPPASESRPAEFEILPGWGANRVAAELKEAGIVKSAQVFAYYLRWQQLDRSIGEGLFDLDPAEPASRTAEILGQGGRPRLTLVVVPEGFRARDVVARLESAGLGSAAEYQELISDPAGLARDWLTDAEGGVQRLEGYLFPASYEIPVRSSPAEVLDLFLDRFEQELTPEALAQLGERGLTVRDWVVLASVVQAEAGADAEMPVIAGVFLNRLDEGMPLQSDPTVAYGLEKDLPQLSASAGDLKVDHDWNTYTRPGLPETPISNPGHAALQAVLHPQRTTEAGVPWLYFLHGSDAGEPVFRPNTSYDAHRRDIGRYLR
jgi:UPF0755 protein